MVQNKQAKEKATYQKTIKRLQHENEALAVKAQALEELHYALLFLKDIKEQFPEKETVENQPVLKSEQDEETLETTNGIFNPVKVKRKYTKHGNQEPKAPKEQRKQKADLIKDKLMKLYGFGNKTSGQLAEVLTYLKAQNNSDMETITKKLSIGNSSLYRYVALLKDNGLIDSVGIRGDIRYIITRTGVDFVNGV